MSICIDRRMDTEQLTAEVEAVGKRFSGELRDRLIAAVGELVSAEISKVEVAKQLGLSGVTVGRYVRKAGGATVHRVRVHAGSST